MPSEYHVRSVAEMNEVAAAIGKQLTAGDVLLLYGELGSGKTTFVRGLAQFLGVSQAVTSPTFQIVAEYDVTGHTTIRRLVHIDLYRLGDAEAHEEMAVREALERSSTEGRLTVVEWAEKLGRIRLAKAKRIKFSQTEGANERVVVVE